jgi:hypothetical protein
VLLAVFERLIALANGLGRLVGRAKGTDPILVRFIPIERAEGRDWSEVLDGLHEIEAAVADCDFPSHRRAFLIDILSALKLHCREGLGDPIPFSTRVATYIGVPGEPVGEDRLAEMEAELADLLNAAGYAGSCLSMLRDWRAKHRVAPEDFETRARGLMADARRTTEAVVAPLPAGTDSELEAIRNVFYNGYSGATGKYRSKITLNADLEWTLPALKHVVAHEAFPGHSALNAIRQYQGLAGELPPEAGLYFANTPITPIIEGTCNLGMRLLGWCQSVDDEIVDLEKRHRAGLSATWAFRLHQDGWTKDRLMSEMMERRGIPVVEAETHFRFLAHPLWCTSIPHYYYGTEAVQTGYLKFRAEGRLPEFLSMLYREVHTFRTFSDRIALA